MIILNRIEIDIRGLALDIIEAGIKSVLPFNLLKSALRYDSKRKILQVQGDLFDLSGRRVFVIGGGKASGAMAKALEEILPLEIITDGVVNSVSSSETYRIYVQKASHPEPDRSGMDGVRKMLALKNTYKIGKDDLVICLISGGGSALLPMPVEGVSLEDKQQITRLLLKSGAEINEINTVRKHLSQIKGGQLGKYMSPATVISLIISDVIGNDLEAIASGPTVPDTSTFDDAFRILSTYNLWDDTRVPESIRQYIREGKAGRKSETPRNLTNCKNYIIGDNSLALKAMAKKAKQLGLNPLIVTAEQRGEPGNVAFKRAQEILDGKYKNYNTIIIGGETTPKLPSSHGKGGRNQHFAAVSLLAMKNYPGQWALASLGTDGSDFLPDAAGAIVDSYSLERAEKKELDVKDYIDRYDTYSLFKKLGESLIITGSTGTNVGDVMVYVLK